MSWRAFRRPTKKTALIATHSPTLQLKAVIATHSPAGLTFFFPSCKKLSVSDSIDVETFPFGGKYLKSNVVGVPFSRTCFNLDRAETMISEEIESVQSEADDIEPGWSQSIWPLAMQLR